METQQQSKWVLHCLATLAIYMSGNTGNALFGNTSNVYVWQHRQFHMLSISEVFFKFKLFIFGYVDPVNVFVDDKNK